MQPASQSVSISTRTRIYVGEKDYVSGTGTAEGGALTITITKGEHEQVFDLLLGPAHIDEVQRFLNHMKSRRNLVAEMAR